MEIPTLTTIQEKDIPDAILSSKDPDEEIYWVGKPENAFAYLVFCGGLKFFGLAIFLLASAAYKSVEMATVVIAPTILLLGFLYLAFRTRMENTHYAVSSRRIIFTTALLSKTTYSIDFDKISEIAANAEWFERMVSVGSVGFAGMQTSGAFHAIKRHEEVCAMVKRIIVDVKTDWQYPNAVRGPVNKGYPTTYQI